MELEPSIKDSAQVNEIALQKDSSQVDSSEDEGIFMSRKLDKDATESEEEIKSSHGLQLDALEVKQPTTETSSNITSVKEDAFESNIGKGSMKLKGVPSEDEDERPNISKMNGNDDDSDDEVFNTSIKRIKRRVAILSDDEDSIPEPVTKGSSLFHNNMMNDSDSEKEDDALLKKRIMNIINSDDEEEEGDLQLFKKQKNLPQMSPGKPKQASKFGKDLADSEHSDDERDWNHAPLRNPFGDDEDMDKSLERDVSMKGKKGKPGKPRAPSLKEKQQELKEIHSETQRMVRDSVVSLPYHKPKQRSLAEFLNRRKKVALPQLNSRRTLKMSMRDMATLKLLEEKKKEVEEFYKSASEEEDPDDMDWKPENELKSPESSLTLLPKDVTEQQENISAKDILQTSVNAEDQDISTPNTLLLKENTDNHLDREVVPDGTDKEMIHENTAEEDSEMLQDAIHGTHSDMVVGADEETAIEGISVGEKQIDDSGIQSRTPSPEESQSGNENDAVNAADQVCEADIEMGTSTVTPKKEKNNEGEIEAVTIDENLPTCNEDPTCTSTKSDVGKRGFLASKLRELNLENMVMSTPKLAAGREGDIIDLDEIKTTPQNDAGLNDFMNRFVKHSNTKRKAPDKHQVNLSIVSKEKDEEGKEKLVSSSIVVDVDAEKEDQEEETVPGARHAVLKSTLWTKIREQRERERMRRVNAKQFMESEEVIEDYPDDGLPDEEAELTDQSETDYETESEPEENDIIIKDKQRRTNKYLDDEAEEDDDDYQDDEKDIQSDGDADADEDTNDTVDLNNKETTAKDSEEVEETDQLKLHWEESQDVSLMHSSESHSGMKRSNTEDLFASQVLKKSESVDKDASITSMDSSFEMYGSVIPAHQPGGGLRRSGCSRPSESEGESTFLTPFVKKSFSTGSAVKERDLCLPIENSQDMFNSSSAVNTSTSPSEDGVSLHLTPMEDSQFPTAKSTLTDNNAAVKLRLDFSGLQGTQQTGDDLAGLCSGKFTESAESNRITNLCDDDLTPTQDINDLMGLCSGQFTSQNNETQNKVPSCPGPFSNLASSQDKHDDNELLELCTGKFTTQPLQENPDGSISEAGGNHEADDSPVDSDDEESRPGLQLKVYSTDEEDALAKTLRTKRKKKRKRIRTFSDDDEDAQDAIEFDDEENEIPQTTFSGFKDKHKGGIRADFLEKEAELSGSDVNSEDEGESDADEMEEEEADREMFDENELRDQVGRAHMKSLLDSDKRELRLLQEMYLEDGELHGEGRQRQFRWRNVDEDNDENERKMLSDNEEGEEDTEDAAWRKQRYEREKFLQEQQAKEAESDETKLFKLGRLPIVRSTSLKESSSKREPLKPSNPVPDEVMLPKTKKIPVNPFNMSKRGSFLSRDKNTLARIAEFTKDKSSVVGGAKQGGNFVFQQLSAEEVEEKASTKMKKSNSVPSVKRARLDRSFFSMDNSSQSSSIFKHL